MPIIYQPKGKAFEYSPLAANLYRGCTHGCDYCYAPDVLRQTYTEFSADGVPRKDVLKQLAREAPKYRGRSEHVLLCFTCDPYQPIEERHCITRDAIRIFVDHDVAFQVLTKNGSLARRDFDLLQSVKDRCKFGTTLLFTEEISRERWEPGAGTIQSRIDAIADAHARGIFTWVSVEPVIDPTQAIALIKEIHPIVDFWKVGKLNHHELHKTIDWAKFHADVIATMEALDRAPGTGYYIKKDLAAFAQK